VSEETAFDDSRLTWAESAQPLTARELTPEAVRPFLEPALQSDAAHDWHHIVRVFYAGLYLANHCGGMVNERALRLALLAHDLGVKIPGRSNALVSPAQLCAAVGPFGPRIRPAELESATVAINEHSWSRGLAPTSLESSILQDADRLDAIGAIGVARCLAYGGAHGRPIRDPTVADCVRHFHDKLLCIRDRLNLEASRELARRRHDLLVQFLAELLHDCEEFSPGAVP
jgi:uncharacterized protein